MTREELIARASLMADVLFECSINKLGHEIQKCTPAQHMEKFLLEAQDAGAAQERARYQDGLDDIVEAIEDGKEQTAHALLRRLIQSAPPAPAHPDLAEQALHFEALYLMEQDKVESAEIEVKRYREALEKLLRWLRDEDADTEAIRFAQDALSTPAAPSAADDRCPCGGFILADTEDWSTPVCNSCYVRIGKHFGVMPSAAKLCGQCGGTGFIVDEGSFEAESYPCRHAFTVTKWMNERKELTDSLVAARVRINFLEANVKEHLEECPLGGPDFSLTGANP